jgi:hypothetical protein
LSLGTEFDLKGLLRMDTATRYKAHSDAIGGGWLAPNEARLDEDLAPADGGSTPFLQQQNFSLAALAERDQNKPFAKPPTAPAQPALPPPEQEAANEEARQAAYLTMIRGYLSSATRHA